MAASMGMAGEMIDWNKPIETVDGHQARYIRGMATGSIVYVLGGPGRCGDVFLVNDEGYRCDDRAIYSKRQEPFIRNVRVKRKAWIRLAIHELYKGDTKEEVEQMITNHDKYKAVYAEWEE